MGTDGVSAGTGERAASLDALREAARAYAEATSQRRAAREIGLSGTGFRAFLNGAVPHAGTLRKLNEWFVQRQASDAGEVSSEGAAAALSLLVAHLPAGERNDAVQHLLDAVETLGQRARLPRWIAHLRE
ncbi:MAG TPA: hypothetical protein VGB24_13995 [Longimicrobium sp.]|jgi:hypothetical protein|uniref:hypothetical protein n=1 Tax=Longimicrobium sp. TaxID=2029185 RepID=UPI002ED80DD0